MSQSTSNEHAAIAKDVNPSTCMEIEQQQQVSYSDVFMPAPYIVQNQAATTQLEGMQQMADITQVGMDTQNQQQISYNDVFLPTGNMLPQLNGTVQMYQEYCNGIGNNGLNQEISTDQYQFEQLNESMIASGDMPIYLITFNGDSRYATEFTGNEWYGQDELKKRYNINDVVLAAVQEGAQGSADVGEFPLDDDINFKMYAVFFNAVFKCMAESMSAPPENKIKYVTVHKNPKITAGVYAIRQGLSCILCKPFGSNYRYVVDIRKTVDDCVTMSYYVLNPEKVRKLLESDFKFNEFISDYVIKVIGFQGIGGYMPDLNTEQQIFSSSFNNTLVDLVRNQNDALDIITNLQVQPAANQTVPVQMTTATPSAILGNAQDSAVTHTSGILPDSAAVDKAINQIETELEQTVVRDKQQKGSKVTIGGRVQRKRGRKTREEYPQFALEKNERIKQKMNDVIRNIDVNTNEDKTIFKPSLANLIGMYKEKERHELRKMNSNEKGNGNTVLENYHYVIDTYFPLESDDQLRNDAGYRTFEYLIGDYKASAKTLRELEVFDNANFTTDIDTFGKNTIALPHSLRIKPYVTVDFGNFQRTITGTSPDDIGYRKMSITGFYSPSSFSIDIDVKSYNEGNLRLIDVRRIKDKYVRALMKSPDIPWYQLITMTVISEESYKKLNIGPGTFYAKRDKLFYKLLYTTWRDHTNTNVNFSIENSPTTCVGFTGYSLKSKSNNFTKIMFLTKPSPIVFSYTTKGQRTTKYYFEKAGSVSYVAKVNGKDSVVRRNGSIYMTNRIIKCWCRRSCNTQSLYTDSKINYEYKYINEIIYNDSDMVIVVYVIPYIVNRNRENPYEYDVVILFYDNMQNLKQKYVCHDFFIYEESLREFIECEVARKKTQTKYVYDVLPAALDPKGDVFPRVVNLDTVGENLGDLINVDLKTHQTIETEQNEHFERMDFTPMGIDPVGIDPVGTDPVSIDPVGIDPVVIDQVGTNPVGVDTVSIDPALIDITKDQGQEQMVQTNDEDNAIHDIFD